MTGKILIVEDDTLLQEAYALILRASGFEVDVAENGLIALEYVRKNYPKLIFLDIYMPTMGGIEFLRAYSCSRRSDVKIVVFSNLSDRNASQELLDLGADRLVLKSNMSPKDLVELAHDLIGSSGE